MNDMYFAPAIEEGVVQERVECVDCFEDRLTMEVERGGSSCGGARIGLSCRNAVVLPAACASLRYGRLPHAARHHQPPSPHPAPPPAPRPPRALTSVSCP